MGRKIYLLMAVLVVLPLLLGVAGCGGTAAPAQTFKLKYAGYFPPDNYVAVNLDQRYMNTVTKQSNNRITFDYYPGEQLGKLDTFQDMIGQGAADMGYLVPALIMGKKPMLGIADLPFLFDRPTTKEWMSLLFKVMRRPEIEAVWQSWNLKSVVWISTGYRSWVTKFPVKTMADLKGKQIRGSGSLQADTIKALGGSPVTMSSAEVYTALATGVVDGALLSPASTISWKWYEQAKYTGLSQPTMSTNSGVIVVNLDVWNKLPKDLQDIMTKAAEEQEVFNIDYFSKYDLDSVERLKTLGSTIIWLDKDEAAKWRQTSRPVWDKWVAANGAPAQALLDFVLKELGEKK